MRALSGSVSVTMGPPVTVRVMISPAISASRTISPDAMSCTNFSMAVSNICRSAEG